MPIEDNTASKKAPVPSGCHRCCRSHRRPEHAPWREAGAALAGGMCMTGRADTTPALPHYTQSQEQQTCSLG
eukprot:2148248-Pleurochrysis_carterae.AAC.1